MSKFKIFCFILVVIFELTETDMNVPCIEESGHLRQLNRWWNEEMARVKPIKCRAPKNWLFQEDKYDQLLTIIKDRIPVKSYPCQKFLDETSIKYRFTAKIEDGILTGPGKLFLAGIGIKDSMEACLSIAPIKVLKIGLFFFQL